MGGSKSPWVNGAANLILLCGSGTTGCHQHIESHRAESFDDGFLIRMGVATAETVPILHAVHGFVLLDDNGGIRIAEEREEG